MPPRYLCWCIVLIALGCGRVAAAAQPASVALTVTRPADDKAGGVLVDNLLSLVEVAIQADKVLTVVERREIDPALQELILDRSRPEPQLQLGKLLTADYLVMLERLPAGRDSPKPWARLRVVESKTGVIRGVTVAALDEETLEETADQFSRYAEIVAGAPDRPTITVAVAPFESVGRFDRLRPLELGVRDLVTARLLRLSGAMAGGAAAGQGVPTAQPPAKPLPAPKFQVVQRSNMDELLRELALIGSGLADKSRLPKELPPRAAVYLIRGEIDERPAGEGYDVVVRGEMLQADTQKAVATFELACPPHELEARLATEVDKIGARLTKEGQIAPPAQVPDFFEVQTLEAATLNDLGRFSRITPTDFSHRRCEIPGRAPGQSATPPTFVKRDTPLGHHLLKKSIDRLESILYITPDDAQAAFALGFCCSLHAPDIYRPDRADELLLKAYELNPDTALAALALGFRAEIAYDDVSGQVDPASVPVTIQRVWFALENTPAKFRDRHWPRYLKLLANLENKPAERAERLAKAAPYAEQTKDQYQYDLGMAVKALAIGLARNPRSQTAERDKALEVLRRWAGGQDNVLADIGRQGLAEIQGGQGDVIGAAAAFEASAKQLADSKAPGDRHKHDVQLVHAAENYRRGGQPQRALELLLSFEPLRAMGSNLVGMHGFEIGNCYQALGDRDKALAAYLRAAEDCPGIVDNSPIVNTINALGGVPLRADRDVDVQYFPRHAPSNAPSNAELKCLATDGTKIYAGGDKGMALFDVASEKWQAAEFPPGAVTCLLSGNGSIWAGTQADGLWRCDPASGAWAAACDPAQLPDRHIQSLATDGKNIYFGVGTVAAGGLARLDTAGKVHVFDETGAPNLAPTHIVVTDRLLLVSTPDAVRQWTFDTTAWSQPGGGTKAKPGPTSLALFAGKSGVWTSTVFGRELARWRASEAENQRFKPTWYNVPGTKAGYTVLFVTERGDDVWFGGVQWDRFITSGLYRFNLKTGAFYKFTPADGFKASVIHTVSDGLWLNDRLWLATTDGLSVVTPRKAGSN